MHGKYRSVLASFIVICTHYWTASKQRWFVRNHCN